MGRNRRQSRAKKTGLPPGTLVHVGEPQAYEPNIKVLRYDDSGEVTEEARRSPEGLSEIVDPSVVTWIHVVGIHRAEWIETIGKELEIHPLVLEDILNTDQRPKLDNLQESRFLLLKHLSVDPGDWRLRAQQVCILLRGNLVVSFQEGERDLFSNIRERIRSGKGRLRRSSPDYLVYALVDHLVDGIFPVLDGIAEGMDRLEEELLSRPHTNTLRTLHQMRQELVTLRRFVWPLREVVSSLERDEELPNHDSIRMFWRDVYDHSVQILETVESFRDLMAEMFDLYLSGTSNRTNEIMRVLTVISTIFIPLTFITSMYGMNFEYMPELESPFAYPLVLLVMVVIAWVMVSWFKKKNWW